MPETLKSEIQKALLEFDDEAFLSSLGFGPFLPAQHEEYESFRLINQYKELGCL